MSMIHLCELCHFYGGYFGPDRAYLCNTPEAPKLMNAPETFDCGKDEPKEICRHFKHIDDAMTNIDGDTSDGYHTFNELYHHRAVLFSVVVAANSDKAWKSKLHHDGTMYDGMFIVGVDTPKGQATYHYDVEPYWDMFWCKELERAPEWDGHTSDDAIERIGSLRGVVFKGPIGRW